MREAIGGVCATAYTRFARQPCMSHSHQFQDIRRANPARLLAGVRGADVIIDALWGARANHSLR